MVIVFAIILSPIVWLFVLAIRTRERPAPTRAECSEHLRTTQWCFMPERAEAYRVMLTRAYPSSSPSPCIDTNEARIASCLDVIRAYERRVRSR